LYYFQAFSLRWTILANVFRGLMWEKGLMEDDWNDRRNWRKKIL